MFKPQRILDPLHNLIEFGDDPFERRMWGIVETQPFQRLRRVKQLGFSDFVYPGASHSRFAHSLGVFHTARQLMGVMERHLGHKNFEQEKARIALAAALVHDIGHGPFSHAFEDVGRRLELKMAHHEHVSQALIREGEIADILKELWSGCADDVATVIGSKGPGNLYNAVVSSQFDADRLDYMRRDRLMAGTQTGAIDFDWLIANLEIGKVPHGVDEKQVGEIETFVLGPKAIHAAETFVLSLFQLYPTLYFHKTTRGAEKIFSELLFRVIRLIQDKSEARTGLSQSHPIVRFAKNPESLGCVLELDDTVVWGSLSLMSPAGDQAVANLSTRLRDRHLYKCYDVRDLLAAKILEKWPDLVANPHELSRLLDVACASIDVKAAEWMAQNPSELPRMLKDEVERNPYREFDAAKGPLNQIRIRVGNDRLVDIVERSPVVAAMKTFKVFRFYADRDDQVVKKFVAQAIDAEVENAERN